MKLTGKCKEEFEEWLLNYFQGDREKPSITNKLNAISFKNVPDSMKWGVYQDYFDNVDLYLTVAYMGDISTTDKYHFDVANIQGEYIVDGFGNSYDEVRVKAIEKANELRNEVLNK